MRVPRRAARLPSPGRAVFEPRAGGRGCVLGLLRRLGRRPPPRMGQVRM
ncbi:Protein of unknown function [Gryllus bimaculatus]|nr:Protein of unknown function [Gryllus bimaculatus]